MARLRLFLTWLLLAALPLQGFAAATVLQCGPAQRALAALEAHQASAGHGHGHRHGHHPHVAPVDAAAHEADEAHVANAVHTQEAGAASPADGHSCFACAAACHAPALAGDAPRIALAPAPQVHADTPFQGFESRPPPVPDKPPRA